MSIELLAGERQANETDKAVIACNDYLRMGPGRSLEKLCECYQNATEAPPTRRVKTLKEWSSEYGWVGRAQAYDANQEAAKTAEIERLRTEGLAADYERIRRLSRLADLIETELYYVDGEGKRSNFWLPDVKQIGGGEFAERVDIVRFNSALVEQYRGTLDDIAKETGGRRQKVDLEHSGKIQHEDVTKLTDEQLERIAAGGSAGAAEA